MFDETICNSGIGGKQCREGLSTGAQRTALLRQKKTRSKSRFTPLDVLFLHVHRVKLAQVRRCITDVSRKPKISPKNWADYPPISLTKTARFRYTFPMEELPSAVIPDSDQNPYWSGLEAVRKKPGMYLGGTDNRALHQCIWEVVANSMDEFMAGHGSKIDLTLNTDGSISIQDDGSGIPVEIDPHSNLSLLELRLSRLHAGGKYGQGGYVYSGGSRGVGAKCVNAVSLWFDVEVARGGKLYSIGFERGKTTSPLRVIGESTQTGTKITFRPDPQIFTETTTFKANAIVHRLRELAGLFPKLTLTLMNRLTKSPRLQTFHFPEGLIGYLAELRKRQVPLHDPIFIKLRKKMRIARSAPEKAQIEIEICFQYAMSEKTTIHSFTNTISNPEEGTHVDGLQAGIVQAFREHDGRTWTGSAIKPNAYRRGLVALVSVLHSDPQFGGCTKAELGSPEVRHIVYMAVRRAWLAFLNANPETARKILYVIEGRTPPSQEQLMRQLPHVFGPLPST